MNGCQGEHRAKFSSRDLIPNIKKLGLYRTRVTACHLFRGLPSQHRKIGKTNGAAQKEPQGFDKKKRKINQPIGRRKK